MNQYLLRRLVIAVTVALVFACALPLPTLGQDEHPLSAEQWRQDLHFLAEQMPLKHKSLFHTMNKAEFHVAVTKLDSDMPALNEDQIFVRLVQIMAMVQDGHTGLSLRLVPLPTARTTFPFDLSATRTAFTFVPPPPSMQPQ